MRISSQPSLLIPALKSFGDCVIVMNAVHRVMQLSDRQSFAVVAGRHLFKLAEALGVASDIAFVGGEHWTDVPAAFDVGKRGRSAALRSLLQLRHELARVGPGAPVLFDRLGWRERFICGAHPAHGLPADCGNIYLAYQRVFTSLGCQMAPLPAALPRKEVLKAVIVPGSRIPRKMVPASVMLAAGIELGSRGIDVSVLKLDGEALDVPTGLRVTTLPRSFGALTTALISADLVISADSLPAHLAEYHRIATFVLTPVANRYWLPLSSWQGNGWATFDELDPLRAWLDGASAAVQTPPIITDVSEKPLLPPF